MLLRMHFDTTNSQELPLRSILLYITIHISQPSKRAIRPTSEARSTFKPLPLRKKFTKSTPEMSNLCPVSGGARHSASGELIRGSRD